MFFFKNMFVIEVVDSDKSPPMLMESEGCEAPNVRH